MTDIDIGPDLQSASTDGLPFPESTDPLNQGANNIKALALALNDRGWGKRSEYRRVPAVAFSGGIGSVTFTSPFSVIPMVIWSPGHPFGASNLALTAGLFGDYGPAGEPISKTGFKLIAYKIAPAAGWYTGPLDVYYLAVGPV